MDGDRHADAGIRARQLLEDEDVGEEVRARPAVLLQDADAHQPELAELREEIAREAVLAVPLRGVRLDLRPGELPRQRLDLALLLAERERSIRPVTMVGRWPPARPCSASPWRSSRGVAEAGNPPSPESVVRAWSQSINADDDEAAAKLFAPGAQVISRTAATGWTTRRAALFNRSLPCSGTITRLVARGDTVRATFLLGDRSHSRCDGPGHSARALFRVRDGKIVLWQQLPSAGADVDTVSARLSAWRVSIRRDVAVA